MKITRENLKWGTYGKDGKQPLTYVSLKDMSDEHIKAVLENCGFRIPFEHRKIFENELVIRKQERKDPILKLMLNMGYEYEQSINEKSLAAC
jgi:hypothetical protein